MIKRDMALIALSLAALMLVAGCTNSNSSGPKYAAQFKEITDSPMTQQGFVPGGKTLNLNFQVTIKNITWVTVQLAFYDDSGDGCPDIMGLEVNSPFADALYLPTRAGESNKTMMINVTIQHTPKDKTGNSDTDLQNYLDGVANIQGTGKWTISISDVEPSPCANPATSDTGNSWVLLINTFHFEGNVTKK
jgi:hypothetical protein